MMLVKHPFNAWKSVVSNVVIAKPNVFKKDSQMSCVTLWDKDLSTFGDELRARGCQRD
jgi:hypothetical protein